MAVDTSQLDPSQIIQGLDPTNTLDTSLNPSQNTADQVQMTDISQTQLSGDAYGPASQQPTTVSPDTTTPVTPALVDQGASVSTDQLGNLGISQGQEQPKYFNTLQEALAHVNQQPQTPVQSTPQFFNTPEEAMAFVQKQNAPQAIQPAPSQQYGPGFAGTALNLESKLPPEAQAFLHQAQGSAAPTVASFGIQKLLSAPLTGLAELIPDLTLGLGAGAAGAEAGAVVGDVAGGVATPADVVTVPVGAIVGFLAGLGTMIATNWAAGQAQDKITQALVPQSDQQMLQQQMAMEQQKYPGYAFAGSMAPQALFMRPGATTLKAAYSGAAKLITNPGLGGFRTLSALEKTALTNVVLGAGLQTGFQYVGGDHNPYQLAASLLFGSLFSEPTALGRAFGMPDMQAIAAGQDAIKPVAIEALRQALLKDIAGKPGEADALKTQLDLLDKARNADPATQAQLIKEVETGRQELAQREESSQAAIGEETAIRAQRAGGVNWDKLASFAVKNGGIKRNIEDLSNGWIFPNMQAVDTVNKDHFGILSGGPLKTPYDAIDNGAVRVSNFGGERVYHVANINDVNSLGLLELKLAVDVHRAAPGDIFSIRDERSGKFVQFSAADWERYDGNIVNILNRAGRNEGTSLRNARYQLTATKAKNFNYSGNWEVNIDGTVHNIFRDPESRVWYEDLPSKGLSHTQQLTQNYLGETKEEALQKLGEKYGIQSQAARFQKGTGEISQADQGIKTGVGSQTSQAGEISSTGSQTAAIGATEPLGITPNRFAATDYSAATYQSRSSKAANLGTTYAEEQAKTGATGWASTSNLGNFRTLVSDAAAKFGADVTKASFNPNVRLLPEEHAALQGFVSKPNDRTKAGEAPIDRANLYIPDDPSLAPTADINREEWKALTRATQLINELRAKGYDLGDIPTGIKDDATRVALILKGWDKRFYYENAQKFVDSINWSKFSPGARERFRASLGVFGDRASVFDNARAALLHHSRLEAGVYESLNPEEQGDMFDPFLREALIENGIYPLETVFGPSTFNLIDAYAGNIPASQKIGDYAGAISGEARAPIDLWNTRWSYGIDNTPTSKIYDYEFGRRNYLTRMFSANDPSILPSHIQSAEWYGYQQLVSERMEAAIKAAYDSNDPALIDMAKGLKSDLVSKDLAEVLRETFGANGELPVYEWDRLVAQHKNNLLNLSQNIQKNLLRGTLGRPSGPREDLRVYQNSLNIDLSKMPETQKALSAFYEKHYLNSPEDSLNQAKVNIEKTLGDSAYMMAQTAYYFDHAEGLSSHMRDVYDALDEVANQKHDWSRDQISYLVRTLREDIPHVVDWAHGVLGIPKGIFYPKIFRAKAANASGIVASYMPDFPNQVTFNERLANYIGMVQNTLADELHTALQSPKFFQMQGYAAAKLEHAVAEMATGNDLSARKSVTVHELIHGITDRFKGWKGHLGFNRDDPPARSLSLAHAMMKDMVSDPAYMEGLVREGLGYELESIIWHVTDALGKGETLNEFLGGVKGAAPLRGQLMPLSQAMDTMLEHQNYQYMQYLRDVHGQDIPHVFYSMATDETYRRNVYEPEIAEANYKRLGAIYDKKLAEVSEELAIEAAARRSGRGPNPAINSSVPTIDESTAGIAAYARLPEARALQSGTSGWGDALAADQNGINQGKLLDQGERILGLESAAEQLRSKMNMPRYEPNDRDQETLAFLESKVAGLKRSIQGPKEEQGFQAIPDSSLYSKTSLAAALPKEPNEGPLEYAQRIIRSSKIYQSLDHATGILRASEDGFFATEIRDGQIYTKVPGTNISYKGTPSSQVDSWSPGFRNAIDEARGFTTQRGEPDTQSPTKIDDHQLREAFRQEFDPNAAARYQRSGKKKGPTPPEEPAPALSSSHFDVLGKLFSSKQLSDNSLINQINSLRDSFSRSMDHVENVGDQGIFDVKSFDPAKVAEDAALIEQGLTPNQEEQLGGPREQTVKPTGRQSAAQKKLAIKNIQKSDTAQSVRGFTQSFTESRKLGDEKLNNVANGVADLVSHLFKTFDITDWQKDPRTWTDDASNHARAFSYLYSQVARDLKGYIDTLPGGANDRIRKAIDVKNQAQYQAELKKLTPQEAAVADLLHNYWQVLGNVGYRSGVLKSFLENYIPHIVEKDSEGKAPVDSRGRFSPRTQHAINRIRDEHGNLAFGTVEELQSFLDLPKVDQKGEPLATWKVKTDLGSSVDSAGIFEAQGRALVKAVLMKTTLNRLQELEVNVGNGVVAKAVATKKYFADLPPEAQKNYISSDKVIGPWKSTLTRSRYNTAGDKKTSITQEPLMIWKPLADQMSREASLSDIPSNGVVNFISRANSWFKQYKFVSPVHIYSLLSNISTLSPRLSGSRMASVPLTMHTGRDIVEAKGQYPDHTRMFQLIKAGLPDPKETIPENMGDVSRILDKIPGMRQFHDILWRQTGYYGLVGLTDRLSKEYQADWIAKGNQVTDADRANFDKQAAYETRKALGYLTNLDMSKDWNLYGNVLLLANRWTTGQLRSLGDAFGIKYLSNLGTGSKALGLAGGSSRVVEGTSPEIERFMKDKNVAIARRLVWGGMVRLAMTSMILSTAISSLLNNGVPYTPVQNFLKDPNHTFDIYAGKTSDPDGTSHDNWIRLPFFLFQREMLDWAMAGVKAVQNGLPIVNADSLGGSVAGAPFARFAGKLNPILQLGIELPLNQELSLWMRGYSNSQISSDKNIVNLQKSLDLLGAPDLGSVESRFLYALRQIAPAPPPFGLIFPTNLEQPTKDPAQVLNALGLGGGVVGGSPVGIGLGIVGSRQEQGQSYIGGSPLSQITLQNQKKAALGQQILAIAQTLGDSTDPKIEQQKLQQIEALRQQAQLTPGGLAQLMGFGAGHNTGLQGLYYDNAPQPTVSGIPATKSINGVPLSPEQDVIYNEIASQREMVAIAQLVSDPGWATMDSASRIAEANSMIAFANKITTEQFGQQIGRRQGTPITNVQANAMLINYATLKKQLNNELLASPVYKAADPQTQGAMRSDRTTIIQNALWAQNFGGLKGSTNYQIRQYVDLTASLRDEVRQMVPNLRSYNQAVSPELQSLILSKGLSFADTLVLAAAEGKFPKGFTAPLTQQQLFLAVRNGVSLSDIALSELHNTGIYQQAIASDPTGADAASLDSKYITLAHSVALADMRHGVTATGQGGFDNAIQTQLAADEAYQQLVDEYLGGTAQLKQFETELSSLKAQFRQDHNIPPSELSKYDTAVNNWYYSRNPEYHAFVEARKNWERYTLQGQAYLASTQANLGYEAASPLNSLIPPA